MKRKTVALLLLLALLLLVVLRLQIFFEDSHFHEEFRILYHLDPARLSSVDYSGEFLNSAPQPFLYKWLTQAMVTLGLDLEQYHRWLGACCYLLFLSGIGVGAIRLGILPAVATTGFAAAQVTFVEQISSATPHAFAFPLLAWMLVSLVHDRPLFGAALTILAGLLYAPVAPAMGLMYAGHVLLLRKALGAGGLMTWGHLCCLVGTGIVALILVAHQIQPLEGYGPLLVPGERVLEFPENGPNGRYAPSVFEPIDHVVSMALGQFHPAVPAPLALALFLSAGVLSAVGLLSLRSSPSIFFPVMLFIIPSLLLFVTVLALRPFISYRFALYPLFTVTPLLFVAGLQQTLFRSEQFRALPMAASAAVGLIFLASLGAAKTHQVSSLLTIGNSERAVLDFLRGIPTDSLIVAWPNQVMPSFIPYATGRALLVDMKAHYPNYEYHLLEMRARMFDLIDAYFATSPYQLSTLSCRWGADYLLLDQASLGESRDSLEYFAPFDARIREKRQDSAGQQRVLANVPGPSVVFKTGRYSLISLEYFSTKYGCGPVDAPRVEPLDSINATGQPAVDSRPTTP
ncbi:hypothetical protein [Thioalkalivibrio sp. XN8]|uniref:hypothetical protein n=1 Tax=Thioalkalivibrio sp. XN8 TaxID=2712863 RepID=UPI0013ECE976|nr:hypothetical protein [Thioalkalivibrio sp. XN8]NGP52163.1 hypothetical protein [Thioalkalivibrio sp. XN8]